MNFLSAASLDANTRMKMHNTTSDGSKDLHDLEDSIAICINATYWFEEDFKSALNNTHFKC
jgi:hypothetical protein